VPEKRIKDYTQPWRDDLADNLILPVKEVIINLRSIITNFGIRYLPFHDY